MSKEKLDFNWNLKSIRNETLILLSRSLVTRRFWNGNLETDNSLKLMKTFWIDEYNHPSLNLRIFETFKWIILLFIDNLFSCFNDQQKQFVIVPQKTEQISLNLFDNFDIPLASTEVWTSSLVFGLIKRQIKYTFYLNNETSKLSLSGYVVSKLLFLNGFNISILKFLMLVCRKIFH